VCELPKKGLGGSREFRRLRPKGPIAGVGEAGGGGGEEAASPLPISKVVWGAL